jgi:tight adherence protein B
MRIRLRVPRRIASTALTAAALAALAATSVSAATPAAPTLREANPGAFPNRAYVLTLPTRRNLETAQVTVTENGQSVDGLSVVPAGQQPGSSATILVLDASNSMQGAPIQAAVAAARAFAQRKPRYARIGIVTFNNTVAVLQPPTDSKAQILAALPQPPVLAEGTHIHDALTVASDLLRSLGATIPSIVLLSDGNDVGSSVSQAQATANAAGQRIRIFSVGLRSGQYDGTAMRRFAADTGGVYAEAKTAADVRPLFEDLGFRLGNEYLVLYRSLQKPERAVSVKIAVSGFGPSAASYTTPALPETAGSTTSGFDKFIQSWLSLAALILIVLGLVGYAVARVLAARKVPFTKRMADFVAIGDADDLQQLSDERKADVRQLLLDADKSLRSRRSFKDFADDVALADIEISPAALVLFSVIGGVLLGLALAVGFGSPFAFLLGLFVPFGVRTLVKGRVDRKRRKFQEQLPDNLDVLAQSLRAGHSLPGSIAVVGRSASEPSATEFLRVARDEQLGVSLEDALASAVRRMKSTDLDQVALVSILQRDAGSNAAEVIDQVAHNIRTRMELRRLARTLTAQGRMARWILTLLPVGVFLALLLVSRDYLAPLWQTGRGIAALIVSAVMIFVGSQIIKKIVDIKV